MIRSLCACVGLVWASVACGPAGEHPAPAAGDSYGSESPELSPVATEACVGAAVPSEQLPLDLFALVDASSSMREATVGGVSKWFATKAAFEDFLGAAPAGMGFGLSVFPVPGEETVSCLAQHYRDASLPIADASESAVVAVSRLEAVRPALQTPTLPAFEAALGLATAHGEAHRERSVVVVLATDGLPTTCDPLETTELARLAAQALASPAHVRTLVVTTLSLAPDQSGDFDLVARAGGTRRALVLDPEGDFAQQLRDALDAAASHRFSCDLALPEAPEHQRLDYGAVNLVLEGGRRRVTFPRVGGPGACTASGGWYYDVEPEAGPPTRLNLCQTTCDALGNAGGSSLRVELGCRTLVR